MTNRPRIGVVLAAGKGTRLKSELPKVLHPVLGKPMLFRVLDGLAQAGLSKVYVIVGHQAERVEAAVQSQSWPFPIECIVQAQQNGTGHALLQLVPYLPATQDIDVLITCGDMPLVPAKHYAELMEQQVQSNDVASLVTVEAQNPYGYGRVVMENKQFLRIIEQKDATEAEKAIRWINAGIYAARWIALCPMLDKLSSNNAQGELYLTDAFGFLVAENQLVQAVMWPDEDDILGVNSRQQLAQAGEILSRRTLDKLMDAGVTVVQPCSVTVAPEVSIEPDTTLYPGCMLEGPVKIGRNCQIGPHTVMRGNISIGDNTTVIQSLLDRKVSIGDNTWIGPFAHLRDNAVIGNTVKIGNFVEVKETRFGDRSNAAHLCYLGDVTVGDDVNMGAGSIIANYDPVRDLKHHSTIEDGAKIGCNSVLISPLKIGEKACIAAGSVITHDVESLDLAISRANQASIKGWVEKTLAAKKP